MSATRSCPRSLRLLVVPALIFGAGCTDAPAPAVAPSSAATSAATSRAVQDTVVVGAADGATVQAPGRVVVGGARAVVSAPLSLRLKRLLVLPGDVVGRGAGIAEVAIPEVADAAATLRGARARRAVVQRRQAFLQTLRQEGLPRVADELAADADAADLDAAIARATALLRSVDVDIGDTALDDLATRGTVTLRAPIAGAVIGLPDTGAPVVGAVIPAGTVLAAIAADSTAGSAGRVRVIVRLPVAVPTPSTATLLGGVGGVGGGGLALKALPGQGGADLQDGATDRVFALGDPASAAVLVDGQGVTVSLPTSSSTGAATTGRVPASAVRLGGDGVAAVAVVGAGDVIELRPVTVLGRVGADLIVEGVVPATVIKRDARAALNTETGGGH